ncbi:hypothetical protein [Mycolicibacterium bacteremicum]|uniref:hypothetical protein n=1 Tax=Mycolicibacterium bacteremicum TaxID=564198 RepID=UPI0026E9C465|nr:hypothetical protein [Mycolicibacterium bacteremicum]
MPKEICQCGHGRAAHEHYRPGTDCALCGPQVCQAYDGPRRSRWRALVAKLKPASAPKADRRPDGIADSLPATDEGTNIVPLQRKSGRSDRAG